MKNILGLDLGTNSIGWAVIDTDAQHISGAGSRIIPMDAGAVNDFEKGVLSSSVAARRAFRSTRRMLERVKQRRSRLHLVLHLLGFLPEHYSRCIDFERHPGQFVDGAEPLLPYRETADGSREFLFQSSFHEMLEDFRHSQPELVADGRKVPYDWTLYYLRKKALTQAVSPQELAWIILSFNAKRGYYQLRGMEDATAEVADNKTFQVLRVESVEQGNPTPKKSGFFDYLIHYNNGAVQKKSARQAPYKVGDVLEAICTTTTDKSGETKISVSIPSPDDWALRKKKTESDIAGSGLTVGTYIYENLLRNPNVKVRGKLVHTIERRFYREELVQILEKQKAFHPVLTDSAQLKRCAEALYRHKNRGQAARLEEKDFTYLFVNDLIFYQRPLKSQKSQIANCPYETRSYVDRETGVIHQKPVKCLPKSHPLFQEFRLWQFISNLRIYEREAMVHGKLTVNVDVTSRFLSTPEDYVLLYDFLNDRKDIKQSSLLGAKLFGLPKAERERYRWNYPEDKTYPCNVTLHTLPKEYRSVFDEQLWHILYSVTDMDEIVKALTSYAQAHQLEAEPFVTALRKVTFTENGYAAYSAKALKRLLPLMRMGRYWHFDDIDAATRERIQLLCTHPDDERITDVVRRNCAGLTHPESYQGLAPFRASYVVYGRHSESADTDRWLTPQSIDTYLNETFRQNSLRNPVVEKVVTETLRVVRDIWKTYGKIDEIHVEMARNLKQDQKGRERDYRRNADNEAANYRARVLLSEFVNPEFGVEGVHSYSPYQLELLKIYESEVIANYAEDFKTDKALYTIYRNLGSSSGRAKVSHADIVRYRLWLEQKYLSPYTGQPISLSRLFTEDYEIEHVIPKARYYDNSMNNKVICESQVNKEKDKMTGYEFILKQGGKLIALGQNRTVQVLKKEAYEEFVKKHYGKNPAKMRNLLMDDIPEDFTHRDLNDTRYMSRYLLTLLSKVVREPGEVEAKSKHVIPTNGVVTTRLKSDWGINDIWNELIAPRFRRMNKLHPETCWGEERELQGKKFFQINQPLELPTLNKKRIDHRHHAMDAIVIACATWNHLTYLNSVSARDEKAGGRYDLRQLLFDKSAKTFKKPWPGFTQEVARVLSQIVVSFKQNHRILTRLSNGTVSVRKPLHADTYYGVVRLQRIKTVDFKKALTDWHQIKDKALRSEIRRLVNEVYHRFDVALIDRYFKDRGYQLGERSVEQVEVYTYTEGDDAMCASRKPLDESFNEKKIADVTDSGIRKILLRHLQQPAYQNEKGNPDAALAFSPEGIVAMNENIRELNEGKYHQPIYKVRISGSLGAKFQVGKRGVKSRQWVVTAKNTNLFFAVYVTPKGKRYFETIPLRVALERKKNKEDIAPRLLSNGSSLLFVLSPDDLVYVPEPNEEKISVETLDYQRIYKVVSSDRNRCSFILQSIASVIQDKCEYGSHNKVENTDKGVSIKSVCLKLQVNRLGQITQILGNTSDD